MKILKWLIAILIALVAAVAVFLVTVHQPRPDGATPGEAADALAREVQRAVELDAWNATGAVRFDFAGRQTHLWDRARGFARVQWDDTIVLLDTRDQTGLARVGGEIVDDPEVLATAWAHHINDTYWLYPFAGFFDDGVTRAIVELEGETRGLLVGYASGGVTPGDAYLWHIGPDGKPVAWQMWVEIIPVGGLEATWSGWQELSTGVPVATQHELGPIAMTISDVKAAHTLAELESDDPFTALADRRGGAMAPASQPTK